MTGLDDPEQQGFDLLDLAPLLRICPARFVGNDGGVGLIRDQYRDDGHGCAPDDPELR